MDLNEYWEKKENNTLEKAQGKKIFPYYIAFNEKLEKVYYLSKTERECFLSDYPIFDNSDLYWIADRCDTDFSARNKEEFLGVKSINVNQKGFLEPNSHFKFFREDTRNPSLSLYDCYASIPLHKCQAFLVLPENLRERFTLLSGMKQKGTNVNEIESLFLSAEGYKQSLVLRYEKRTVRYEFVKDYIDSFWQDEIKKPDTLYRWVQAERYIPKEEESDFYDGLY